MTTGKKIAFALCSLWTGITSFFAPIAWGMIFMDITGHGKGYDYDLGPEKDISVMFGFAELVIWTAVTLPALVFVMYTLYGKRKVLILIPIAVCICLFVCGIFFVGGFEKFLLFFNLRV
ncbi:MAG: hypothetical protein IK093_16935 [Ruminiclostridium sp.]|nr:hypothetical protein [Ruminiclostridium sp.]